MQLESHLRSLIAAHFRYQRQMIQMQNRSGPLFIEIRKKLNLTQRELAAKLDVDHTYVSKIENGHMQPGYPLLEKLYALTAEPLPV